MIFYLPKVANGQYARSTHKFVSLRPKCNVLHPVIDDSKLVAPNHRHLFKNAECKILIFKGQLLSDNTARSEMTSEEIGF